MLLLLLLVGLVGAEKCMHPPAAVNYTNAMYSGRWYEVGKYQTPGGAAFQKGTVCTIATYDPYSDTEGGGDIGYSSRKTTPDGSWNNATGILEPLENPGHFLQTLVFFGIQGPSVDYNVIYLDEDSAIEYDCSEHIFGTLDYCLHFMSRTPTMSEEKLEMLMDFVAESGLNTHNLEYMVGNQENCWE
ncbi:apolipoprotein D [Eurytemora carolleeae]|uniref:apolipoprotein D n=1 Tax=Eurytemora carolleeae TaxID=1294199 RepID=UPI000C7724AD|nr:apolipoprotein D [Eurytemora carolleeae]|eukprot:XP_023337716.1 apolipoprotein D-like [Eurytemora affinis]